ncbi:GNAT family N-acetyltransferase [Vibrio sp. WJH972]
MSKLDIREAVKSDAGVLSGLLVQLGYDTDASTIDAFLSSSTNDHSNVYVGVLEGHVVAVMSILFFDYFPSGKRFCRITALVVDDSMRGKGVGSTLIEYAKSKAIAEKCSILELTTSLSRVQTQRYYERIGFEKTSYKYVQKLDRNG